MSDEEGHLDRYHAKRDFDRTREPRGEPRGDARDGDKADDEGANQLEFVVQKHAARRLHYDVRLEVDGVMPSWAVPKGPSYNPKTKRLAMHVEDHPLDYRTFEGTIPKGEYGGGAVIVWDNGTYRNITQRHGQPVEMREAIENGHVSVWLEGTKLRGGWALTRTHGGEPGKDSWIMVKRADETADPAYDVETDQPNSVLTGRSIEDVAQDDRAAQWTRGVATYVPPMLAQLSDRAPVGEGWVFERKLDGLRCVAVRNGDDVQLWSRNHLSFNKRFPEVVAALKQLPIDNFTFDGELVAYDGEGHTSFALLQHPKGDEQTKYSLFDVVHLLAQDTTGLSLLQRKELLSKAISPDDVLELVPHCTGSAEDLLQSACSEGWEGLIAKRSDALYTSGRSSAWLKLKCSASQELVIGGWTEPKGTRSGFGALLVGYHDGSGFRYAGKVGTGFDNKMLTSLHAQLVKRERDSSPFVDTVREKTAHWIEPELVANIAFTEWTRDGKLRHPRFEGLRPDKEASAVVRERST